MKEIGARPRGGKGWTRVGNGRPGGMHGGCPLSLRTEEEMVGQVDKLHNMGVPVERVELGNEAANSNCTGYYKNASLVAARIRALFPHAEIGIIGS